MHQNITALNKSFGISDIISFRELGEEFPVAYINTDLCTASIALQGAHLLSWIPAGEKTLIWISEDAHFATGKSIRGGIPVCWPWFGAHDSHTTFPAHGFARTSCWDITATDILANGSCRISFQLAVSASHPFWPHPALCELHMIFGTSLCMELVTTNRGDQPMTISQALHTYFAVGDIRSVSVTGLDKCAYLDKSDNFKQKQQNGPVNFSGEVDRVYLDTAADCLIHDDELKRIIRIAKTGSASTIVWNPWQQHATTMGDMGEDGYLTMLCVESANAADDNVTIEAGASHTLSVYYSMDH